MLLRAGSTALVLLHLPVAGEARETAPVRFEYLAPPGCPNRQAVLDAIEARNARLRLAEGEEPARLLRIHLEGAGSSFHGELQVSETDGSTMQREVEGPTCDAVVSALALVAAISVDPLPRSGAPDVPAAPLTAPAPVSASAPAAGPPAPPPTAALAGPTVRSDPRALIPVAPQEKHPARAPREEPFVRSRVRVGLGISGELLGFSAPNAVFAPAAAVELAVDRAGMLAPSFRVGFARAEGGSVQGGAGSASFTWLLGRGEACPLRIRLVATLALRPCVALDAGAITSDVSGLSGTLNPSRAWLDLTAEARLEWRVLQNLSINVDGGFLVPLVRDSFVFEPSSLGKEYETPEVLGVGSLGIMVLFL
jgi:hypothetical protein